MYMYTPASPLSKPRIQSKACFMCLAERTQILTVQSFINGTLVTHMEYIRLSLIMVIQVHSLQHSHEEAVLVSVPDKSQLSTSGPVAIEVQQLTFDPSAHHKQSLKQCQLLAGC